MSIKTRYNLIIGLGTFLLIIGYLFLIMHWPYGLAAMIIGYALIGGTYPRYIIQQKGRSLNTVLKGSGILIWSALNICNIYFYGMHNFWLSGLALVALMVWLFAVIYSYLFADIEKQTKTTQFINAAFIIGGALLAIGTLFKSLHWPNTTILFLIGGVIFGGSLFVILFGNEE